MQKYLFRVLYKGTNYSGWQSQKDHSGIQDYFEKALGILFQEEHLSVTASSRTDSGVHALDQCITSTLPEKYSEQKLQEALNALTPQDLSVHTILKVNHDFHPIRAAKAKVYAYRVYRSSFKNCFVDDFAWHLRSNLFFDAQHMSDLLKELEGVHDFTVFCAADSQAKTMVRTIYETQLEFQEDAITIWLRGNGFLKQMVRSIVGSLMDHMRSKTKLSLLDMIQSKNRSLAGVTAPAKGLCLAKIFFENEGSVAEAKDFARSLKYNLL